MKELAELILSRMIDKPEELEITEEQTDADNITLTIKVNPSDIGKVIGKQGTNIQAVRTILKAVSAKEQRKRITLKLDGE